MLFGHGFGAVAALVLHRVGCRRDDRWGVLAWVGVPVVLMLLGALFWWS
jgi:hypothetical protein